MNPPLYPASPPLTRDELQVRDPRGRGRSSPGCPRRSWYHDGRRRRPIERHLLHQLGEARVVAQRAGHRMHSEIRRPTTTLVDGAIDPVERTLIVAESERDENHVDGRYVV